MSLHRRSIFRQYSNLRLETRRGDVRVSTFCGKTLCKCLISHIRSCHFTQLFQNLRGNCVNIWCTCLPFSKIHSFAKQHWPDLLFLPRILVRMVLTYQSSKVKQLQQRTGLLGRSNKNIDKFMETLHKQNILSACTSVWGVWDCNWTVVSSGRWDHHCCPWRIGTVTEVRAR